MNGIYRIWNLGTLCSYIGSTGTSFESRWQKHKSELRFDEHYNCGLQRDWNIYPEKWWSFEVLEEVSDRRDLRVCEQKWIETFLGSGRRLYNVIDACGNDKINDNEIVIEGERMRF